MTEMTSTTAEEQAPPEPEEKFQRKRGAGFPIVPLSECVEVLRTAGKHGNEHSSAAFATYLGHSTPNSGSFKSRLASFRDWKFIANATGNRVVFTDLGRRIAHPTDPAKEKRDLQEAFENCTIFMRAWDEAAKGVPMWPVVLGNLGVQLGVSPVSKEQFAESLIESAAAAGFAELDGDQVIFIRPTDDVEYEMLPPAPEPEARVREPEVRFREPEARIRAMRPQHVDDRRRREFEARLDAAVAERERDESAHVGPVGQATREALAALHQQSFQIPGGSLTFEIRSNRSLPAEAFMQIGRVMAEVEKLRDLLTESAESPESTE
jgi:hypothetical protein